ncbi:SGNH/GDSL hydrolase family protein [Streptomyces sp. 2A115]|uniref:SGNH/GDSL hydrolase family protein n=1 Tax=Streptomyces sp. 2A115 TaxID=3457439 RepID=UPI003FD3EA87
MSGGAVSAAATDSSAQGSGFRYVALGDSYASGQGLGSPTNVACNRSSINYPSLLAGVYKAELKDVTCSGATTRSLWNPQDSAPPQVNALTKDTDLVTVSLGGNDFGFASVLEKCVLATLSGTVCKDALKAAGYDFDDGLILLGWRIRDMLTDIHKRSPDARVAVVGYPNLFPATGNGCNFSSVPLAKGDLTYLDGLTKRLNTMLRSQEEQGGAVYADTYTAFKGHDMRQPRDEAWVGPLLPLTNRSAHPSRTGHMVMADQIQRALKQA